MSTTAAAGHSQEATAASRISAVTVVESGTSGFSKFTGSDELTTGSPNGENIKSADFQPGGTVPPEHDARTLVLCFDGTGDQFDADNSNIVQLFSMLKKDDRSKQMVYYQAGIGTYESPQIATPLLAKVSKVLDEMIAWNLDAHLMAGYEFLMQNYTTGDRICIFGFSRGAYTARCLAGMLHKVGLLPTCNHQQVPFAYKMYTRTDEVGWQQSNAFKRAFSIDVSIEFIGVWDTVNSVGLIPRRLPFTTSNTIVKTFRHAVSLDEHRAKFKANLWNRPNAEEATLGLKPETLAVHKSGHHDPHKTHSSAAHLERVYSEDSNLTPTDIDEVWFAGCHCDVGGGSVSNDTPNNLARIPLRWMIRECFKTGTGIMFDPKRLQEVGLDPGSLYPFVLPRPPHLPVGSVQIQSHSEPAKPDSHIGTEEDEELKDALTPMYDQLQLAWFWWILEILPIKQRYQKGDASWVTTIRSNLGRPRVIPKQVVRGVKVHRSVKMRMEAGGPRKYAPKAKFSVDPTWVD
jgi:uncharacterized protein (DUF2235 family)